MQKVDLLNGRIVPSLMRLSLPIMGTSLVQMAYNLTDMIWIGRLSADAVAACICGCRRGWRRSPVWAAR